MLMGMRVAFVLFIHLIASLVKLIGPGGARGLLAESLILKHQLMVSNRSRQRAPNLTTLGRFLLGITSLFVRPHRIDKLAVVVSTAPTTTGPSLATVAVVHRGSLSLAMRGIACGASTCFDASR